MHFKEEIQKSIYVALPKWHRHPSKMKSGDAGSVPLLEMCHSQPNSVCDGDEKKAVFPLKAQC